MTKEKLHAQLPKTIADMKCLQGQGWTRDQEGHLRNFYGQCPVIAMLAHSGVYVGDCTVGYWRFIGPDSPLKLQAPFIAAAADNPDHQYAKELDAALGVA